MPLNTLRLNHQRSSHPNERIIFIKPLERPAASKAEYDLADTFLRAIAAQCLPLMKKHYLSVTTLEEYEPNREFIGRNFNNGEIIQLVLRSKSGGWVPFNMVQMVMMHELAHNSHMNHGKLFWQTRNLYAEEMKALWSKGYTGEGFWGSGRTLNEMGVVMGNNILSSQDLEGLPLCGGTYRSRRRKRKARGAQDKPELTWREKQDRRIERKFGKNGVTLGEDEDQRLALEINKKGPIGGKPRVAQSKRGRELRAAAALARFAANRAGENTTPKRDDPDDELDDQYEEDTVDAGQEDALDLNGEKLLDGRGQGMVRVCDDEDTDDINVKQEMTELENLHRYFKPIQQHTSHMHRSPGDRDSEPDHDADGDGYDGDCDKDPRNTIGEIAMSDTFAAEDTQQQRHAQDPLLLSASSIRVSGRQPVTSAAQAPCNQTQPPYRTAPTSPPRKSFLVKPAVPRRFSSSAVASKETEEWPKTAINSDHSPSHSPSTPPPGRVNNSHGTKASAPSSSSPIICPICSLENPRMNSTCLACSHVIDPAKDPRHWSCKSEVCRDGPTAGYLNSGDTGICGVCGTRRMS
ncbi:uncharacterized protein A1O9_01455 [Exophiala aquamarina CBS 119918]|uniref:WLM domain-containing protein n=1 Tax=Exophiala aquamarina CBS 119918 TaxID=1182545 RepID=A0A072PUP3_9EURO|nr:uncharacterized protein A1O9_01455 [Exophiala aquamarina CBS 119918]KEF63477.1 hypothetical protein A1O9_01455 [Exophiala aquamarina CBS 119918]